MDVELSFFYGSRPRCLKGDHRGVGKAAMCTHCLADACVAYLIDAACENPAREGDVEAEVYEHVPKLATHTNRPAVRDETQNL